MMTSKSRIGVESDMSKSAEDQSRFEQTAEAVTQVIGDRYLDPDQLKRLLDDKFPGTYKMQVSKTVHLPVYR